MNVTTLPTYPNVLLSWGAEYHGDDNRHAWFSNIDALVDSPIHNGDYDFIVVYAIPDEDTPNHFFEDMSIVPKPRRGAITMDTPPIDNLSMPDHIHVLLQEVAHHWLCFRDRYKFIIDSVEVMVPSGNDVAQWINNDIDFNGKPIIIGRSDIHWSAFLQADGSPMDGLAYDDRSREAAYSIWKQDVPYYADTATIFPEGLDALNMLGYYCDLDKIIMGAMNAGSAYSFRNHQIKWIEPKLVAPLEYQVGLILMFHRHDFIFFGFHQHHRKLVIQKNQDAPYIEVEIDDYAPLEHDYNALALRIVRRGDDYYFQARKDNPLAGCINGIFQALGLRSNRVSNFFEDLNNLTEREGAGNMDRYRTIFHLNAQQITSQPKAIGTVVKKWSGPSMVEGTFFNFEILKDSRVTFTTDRIPTLLPTDFVLRDINEATFYAHVPKEQTIILSRGGRIHITAILDQTFDLNATIDEAPKLLAKAPDGDFSFGSIVNVRRSCFTPWAAGYAIGKSIWGKEKGINTNNIQLTDSGITRQPPPPADNIYKIIFIVTAETRMAITDDYVRRVDNVRRYFDAAFSKATNDVFHSDSSLL